MNTTEYKQMTATHEKVNSIIKMDQSITRRRRSEISQRLREHSYTEVGRQRHEDADGRVPVRIVRNLSKIEMPLLETKLHRQLARDALWRFKEWIWENGDETQKTYIEKISKHPRAATGWMPPAPKPVPVAVVVELLLAEPEPEPVAEPKPSLFIGLGNCGPAPVADIESDDEEDMGEWECSQCGAIGEESTEECERKTEEEAVCDYCYLNPERNEDEEDDDDEGRCKRKRCAFVHCSGGNSCGSYDTDDDDDDDEDDDEDEAQLKRIRDRDEECSYDAEGRCKRKLCVAAAAIAERQRRRYLYTDNAGKDIYEKKDTIVTTDEIAELRHYVSIGRAAHFSPQAPAHEQRRIDKMLETISKIEKML